MARRRLWVWLRVVLLLVTVGLGVQVFWLEPASLQRKVHVLSLRGWPESCDGLRVAVLADLHVGSPYYGLDKLREVVAETNAARPDLVLLAGDYVIHGVLGGQFVAPEAAAAVLAELRAPLGTFAVLGNHDWWLDPARVAGALAEQGIEVLEDANRTLTLADCTFTLVGVSDYWEGPHDLTKALAGVPVPAPVVLFTHNPDVFPELPRPLTLAVAGHTHGGQVAFPWLGALVVPSRYGQRFAAGRIVEDDQTYFVSTGLGTSIAPVRFRVAPEISLLHLRAAAP